LPREEKTGELQTARFNRHVQDTFRSRTSLGIIWSQSGKEVAERDMELLLSKTSYFQQTSSFCFPVDMEDERVDKKL